MRRWHRRALVLLIPLLAIGIVRASDDESIPFAVGQRWEYVTRPQDAGSTLVVVKIDRDRVHGHIVSVHVSGLHVKKALLELPGRGDEAITPECAAEVLLDLIGDDERDALTFVEDPSGQQRIERHAQERRRSALRAESAGAR